MIIQIVKYTIPLHIFFHYTYNIEKDLCRGVVFFTVLCDHPYLVSLLFAVLVTLHPVTFSNVLLLLYSVQSSLLQELMLVPPRVLRPANLVAHISFPHYLAAALLGLHNWQPQCSVQIVIPSHMLMFQ